MGVLWLSRVWARRGRACLCGSLRMRQARGLTTSAASALAPAATSTTSTQPTRTPLSSLEQLQKIGERLTDRTLVEHELSDNPGARKKRKRWGRGPGSGRGKTCGRGHKGSKAREGKNKKPWFEGGQSPLYKRTPKWGHKLANLKERLTPVNLNKLILFCKLGRIDAAKPITMKIIKDSGLVGGSRIRDGMKLLSRGGSTLKESGLPPLNIQISHTSKAAKQAIEENGGSVALVYHTPLTLRAHLKPHKFDFLPRTPRIIARRKRERYAPYIELHKARIAEDEKRKNPYPLPVVEVGPGESEELVLEKRQQVAYARLTERLKQLKIRPKVAVAVVQQMQLLNQLKKQQQQQQQQQKQQEAATTQQTKQQSQ